MLRRGAIELTYTMDGLPADNCHGLHRRATFTFTCLPGTLGEPKFDYEDNSCHYFFLWETSAACSVKRTRGSDCAVTDPVSLLSFNLKQWASEVGVVTFPTNDQDGTLHIAACGSVPECNGAGACVVFGDGTKSNFGAPASDLTFADNELRLAYTGGDECSDDPQQRLSTFITFVCPSEFSTNATAVRYYDCNLYVSWPTERACRRQREASCVVSDPETGEAYDLSPLEKSQASKTNWIVNVHEEGHDFEYILNVCHSLNDQVMGFRWRSDIGGGLRINGERAGQ